MSVPLAIVLLTFLAACDAIYGVSRRAKVGFMPDPAKVRSIMHRVARVHEVRYQQTEGGKPITLGGVQSPTVVHTLDRKSTRLNSSHVSISYAVFCLKKKKKN